MLVATGNLLAQSDAILQRLEQVARQALAEYALNPLARLIRSGRGVLLQPESLQVTIQRHGDAEEKVCRGIRFRVAPWAVLGLGVASSCFPLHRKQETTFEWRLAAAGGPRRLTSVKAA